MDWVKLAQRYYFDTAIRGLPDDVADAAEVMFTRGLARAGEVGQHGYIPEQDVELLTRRRRHGAVVDALLKSGLWTEAPGGYQVVRWSDWQDHLDALTRKRAADRERQRRRRAAANGASTSEDRHPPPLSRDPSRDVTAVEGEGELEGVQVGGIGTATRARDSPPRCPKHTNDPNPPNCGGCRDARLAAENAERQQVAARVERDRRARDSPKCDTCTKPLDSTYHRRFCEGAP